MDLYVSNAFIFFLIHFPYTYSYVLTCWPWLGLGGQWRVQHEDHDLFDVLRILSVWGSWCQLVMEGARQLCKLKCSNKHFLDPVRCPMNHGVQFVWNVFFVYKRGGIFVV